MLVVRHRPCCRHKPRHAGRPGMLLLLLLLLGRQLHVPGVLRQRQLLGRLVVGRRRLLLLLVVWKRVGGVHARGPGLLGRHASQLLPWHALLCLLWCAHSLQGLAHRPAHDRRCWTVAGSTAVAGHGRP